MDQQPLEFETATFILWIRSSTTEHAEYRTASYTFPFDYIGRHVYLTIVIY